MGTSHWQYGRFSAFFLLIVGATLAGCGKGEQTEQVGDKAKQTEQIEDKSKKAKQDFPLAVAPFDAKQAKQNVPLAVAPFDAKQAKQYQEACAERLKTTVELTNKIGMKLRLIPPGEFTMGDEKGDSNEKPVSVTLTEGFWLGKYEVTQRQWKAVMGTTPWKGKSSVREDSDNPAVDVSWEDAISFCQKLTEKERNAGRLHRDWEYTLPTEAQWEYACRAGTSTAYSYGDDAEQLGDYAWYNSNAERKTHPVGKKKPNAWGLCDMSGNVSEWCKDAYQEKLPGGTDPEVTNPADERVVRGGNWYKAPQVCRSARRSWGSPGYSTSVLGFRVAAVPASQSAEPGA